MSDFDLSGTVLDGRYKVISPISEGAMGSVYRGERIQLGRAVAIKVMHEALPDELSSRQRFEREAKLMAMLEHPNCVSVIDFGVHDDKPFLVMELVRGTSLQQLIEQHHHLEIARAADIMRQVLAGLAHAHELGIIHRDIKPANIMVSEQSGLGERVRILDFGLARLAEGSTKLTTGIVVGTPNYMAPEQCKGGDLDGRTDLYACGVMLFELLTGRKPFVADDPIAVVRKHIGEPPPRLADIAPGNYGDFEAIVARALAKDPAGRFESAEAMAQAIDAAMKKGAAQVFARAVPQAVGGPGSGPAHAPQMATPSGWNVPSAFSAPDSGPAFAAGAPPGSLSIPTEQPSQPLSASQFVPSDSSPVTASQIFDPGSHPVPSPYAQSGSAPVPSAFPQPGSAPVPSAFPQPDSQPYTQQGASTQPVTPSQIFDPAAHAAPPIDRNSQARIFDPGPQNLATSPLAPSTPLPPRAPTDDPNARSQARPGTPISRKTLAIAGGGLLAVVILIAVVASRGGHKATKPAGDAAVANVVTTPDDPVPGLLAHADELAQGGDPEAALSVLTKARKEHPDSAPLALAAGKLYFNKLWWTDGIKEFRDAIRLDPSLRSDPDLIKTVLRGFNTTPDIDDRIEEFLREDLGEAARPYLEETAKSHPNRQIRARAQAELRHLR